MSNIRKDIIEAAGPLQTCAGLKAGIEASIHAMRSLTKRTEGVVSDFGLALSELGL